MAWANNGAAHYYKALAKVRRGGVEENPDSILELVTTVTIAKFGGFVARDNFKIDTSKKARVKIAFLWESFSGHFPEKIEENVSIRKLSVHKLLRSSMNKLVMDELGEYAETNLVDLWMMLEMQPNGEEGALLTNGWANIFYMKDKKGMFRIVNANWCASYDGWSVYTFPVWCSRPQRNGYQVISR